MKIILTDDKKNTSGKVNDNDIFPNTDRAISKGSVNKKASSLNGQGSEHKAKVLNRSYIKEAVWMIIIFAAYFVTGKFGLNLALENMSVSAVWAPTGISIAAFLLRGYRIWPAVFLGALIVNLTTSGNIPSTILIATGNTAEGLIAAFLVNKIADGKNFFHNTQGIFKFFILAGVVSTALGATIGTVSLSLFSLAELGNIFSVWLTWWLGDAVGAFLVAPLIILWTQYITGEAKFNIHKDRFLEGLCVFLTLIIVSIAEFTPFSLAARDNYPFGYIIFIPFVWIAFRFSVLFITTAAFGVCVIAIWGTVRGYGPFIADSTNNSLLFLQAFICLLTVMSISLASVIRERNKNESILRENEKDLRDFVENASVGIHGVGPDGVIIWANKSELDLLGYTADEYIGRHISEFHADQNRINEILKRLKNNETIHDIEAQLICKNGSKKDVLISSNVLWKKGDFIHTRCFTKDITDRKRMELEMLRHEEALHEADRRSKEEFQRLLEKLPAGAYTCDTNGLITYYNEKAAIIWGRKPRLNDPIDKFCGSFKLFINDEPIAHDKSWMAIALEEDKDLNGEEIIIERPDGTRLTAMAHANPIHDEAGKVVGAVNVLVDISDRKMAEKHLNIQYSISKSLAESDSFRQASQRLLQAICEGLGWELGLIWVVDNKSEVLRQESEWHSSQLEIENSGMLDPERTFEKGVGLPGRVWSRNDPVWIPDVTIDDNFPRAPFASKIGLHAGLAFPIRSGNDVIGVIECFNKKILEPKEVLLEVLNASGRQIGNFLRRKLAEEEKEIAQQTYQSLLKSAHDKLESRVKERTMELKVLVEDLENEISERKRTEEKLRLTFEKLKETQYELIHSEKLASLGRFSSGIAHEIRNPLANISALAQLLNSKKNLDPGFKTHLTYILENTNIANNIIKDLLNIASPHNVNLAEKNIGTIIDNLYNIVNTRCAKANIRLYAEIESDLPEIMLNEEKLQSAFLNFVSNAIDAMPDGGELKISAGKDKMTNEAILNFEDTGYGISQENIDKILEPFFTTKSEGTGLGLCLAYHVIEAHSGKIDIKSEINKGTKITVRLPANPNNLISE